MSFNAVQGFALEMEEREKVSTLVGSCVNSSGAALGMLLYEDALIAYEVNEETPLSLVVDDVHLLAHFVGNSKSLRTHDQNWVPICLPHFNEGLAPGLCLQYSSVSDFTTAGHIDVLWCSFRRSSLQGARRERDLSKATTTQSRVPEMLLLVKNQSRTLAKFLRPAPAYFLCGVGVEGSGLSQSSPRDGFHWTRRKHKAPWSQYQRLALCLRVGSSSVEVQGAEEEEGGVSVLSSNPARIMPIAAVLASGYVVVGITTRVRLYATKSCGGAIEACGLANLLNRAGPRVRQPLRVGAKKEIIQKL